MGYLGSWEQTRQRQVPLDPYSQKMRHGVWGSQDIQHAFEWTRCFGGPSPFSEPQAIGWLWDNLTGAGNGLTGGPWYNAANVVEWQGYATNYPLLEVATYQGQVLGPAYYTNYSTSGTEVAPGLTSYVGYKVTNVDSAYWPTQEVNIWSAFYALSPPPAGTTLSSAEYEDYEFGIENQPRPPNACRVRFHRSLTTPVTPGPTVIDPPPITGYICKTTPYYGYNSIPGTLPTGGLVSFASELDQFAPEDPDHWRHSVEYARGRWAGPPESATGVIGHANQVLFPGWGTSDWLELGEAEYGPYPVRGTSQTGYYGEPWVNRPVIVLQMDLDSPRIPTNPSPGSTTYYSVASVDVETQWEYPMAYAWIIAVQPNTQPNAIDSSDVAIVGNGSTTTREYTKTGSGGEKFADGDPYSTYNYGLVADPNTRTLYRLGRQSGSTGYNIRSYIPTGTGGRPGGQRWDNGYWGYSTSHMTSRADGQVIHIGQMNYPGQTQVRPWEALGYDGYETSSASPQGFGVDGIYRDGSDSYYLATHAFDGTGLVLYDSGRQIYYTQSRTTWVGDRYISVLLASSPRDLSLTVVEFDHGFTSVLNRDVALPTQIWDAWVVGTGPQARIIAKVQAYPDAPANHPAFGIESWLRVTMDGQWEHICDSWHAYTERLGSFGKTDFVPEGIPNGSYTYAQNWRLVSSRPGIRAARPYQAAYDNVPFPSYHSPYQIWGAETEIPFLRLNQRGDQTGIHPSPRLQKTIGGGKNQPLSVQGIDAPRIETCGQLFT
jgi:hypothetical protein